MNRRGEPLSLLAPFTPLALAALLALAEPASALEVYLAPLALEEETAGMMEGVRPEEDLLRALAGLGAGGCVRRAQPESGEAPRSLLEAARWCERQGYPLLLYGFVRGDAAAFSAELKLLDRDSMRIAAVLIGSDDAAHYGRLMSEMAAKLVEYLQGGAGLKRPPQAQVPARNLVEFWAWAGYWTPTGGEWGRVLAGIGSTGLGVRFIPAHPLFRLWSRDAYVSLGLDLEYALGMNEPGYESFFLHQARVRLPLDVILELSGRQAVGIGAGLSAQLDLGAQDRKYSPSFLGAAAAPGLSLCALYRYSPSARLSFGLAGLVEAAAYSPPLFTFSPRIFLSYGKRSRDE
jgi:hypothetical protein